MKRLTAYLMLAIYLPLNVAIAELSKMPLLLEHYTDHKEKKPDTNILSFVYNHYMMDDDQDNDQQEDGKLPFRAQTHTSTIDAFVVKAFDVIPLTSFISGSVECPDLAFSRQNGLPLIWQPPRA